MTCCMLLLLSFFPTIPLLSGSTDPNASPSASLPASPWFSAARVPADRGPGNDRIQIGKLSPPCDANPDVRARPRVQHWAWESIDQPQNYITTHAPSVSSSPSLLAHHFCQSPPRFGGAPLVVSIFRFPYALYSDCPRSRLQLSGSLASGLDCSDFWQAIFSVPPQHSTATTGCVPP